MVEGIKVAVQHTKELVKRTHNDPITALCELAYEFSKIQSLRVSDQLRLEARRRNGQPTAGVEASYAAHRSVEEALDEAIRIYGRMVPAVVWAEENVRGVGVHTASILLGFMAGAQNISQAWAYFGLVPGAVKYNRIAKSRAIMAAQGIIRAKDDYYYPLYKQKRNAEWRKNLAGVNAEEAKRQLAAKRYGKGREWLEGLVDPEWVRAQLERDLPLSPVPKEAILATPAIPMITPAHVNNRAVRWLAKLYMSHLFEVHAWYTGRRAPVYAFKVLGHAPENYIPPKNAPWGDGAPPAGEA